MDTKTTRMVLLSLLCGAAVVASLLSGCSQSSTVASISASKISSSLEKEQPSTQTREPSGSETTNEPSGGGAASESSGSDAASESGTASSGESAASSLGESGTQPSGTSEKSRDPNYILPDSDKIAYSTAELEGLSDDELYFARNELFARHGARFGDEELSKHFGTKAWYRSIEPKLDKYGTEILNLVESTNAATIRRIELERGSEHVNPLDPKRAEMYEAYRAKAEEYQERYGAAESVNRDTHDGLTGLCLAQLIDFDSDGWEELLLAIHDGDSAPEGDFFNPDSYWVEVWSHQNGVLEQAERADTYSTQATSSYFLLCRTEDGYEFGSSKSQDGGLVYYYTLSRSNNPAMGDRYWSNESDVSFGFDQMQTITAETLATLGAKSGTA